MKDIGIRVRSHTNFVMPALFHPIIPIFLTVLLRKCFFLKKIKLLENFLLSSTVILSKIKINKYEMS